MMKHEGQIWNQEITNPVSREVNSSRNFYDPDQIINRWREKIAGSKAELFFILDLDENLFNSAAHWVTFSNTFLRLFAAIDLERLPTEEVVMAVGGPSTYYPLFFPDVFPTTEAYEVLADEMRHRYAPNRLGKAMHPNLSELISQLNGVGEVLGGLTARPETQVVRDATKAQLHPVEMEVVYKPVNRPLAEASREKIERLETLSHASSGVVVLIDDSLSTAKVISEWNKSRNSVQSQPIVQILNGLGPLTAPKLEQGLVDLDQLEGVFLLSDWSDLDQVITDIQSWLTNLPQA